MILISLMILPSASRNALAEPAIILSPVEGPPGTMAEVTGSGFIPLTIITVTFDGGNMKTRPDTISTSALGTFKATFEVPHSIQAGSYSVVATGHGLLKVTATSSFQVVSPNNPPLADSQSVTTDMNEEIRIQLRGSDPDGDEITYAIVDQPQHGIVNELDANAGSLMYVPESGYDGKDRLTFKVSDGQDESFLAEVSIKILPTDSGPRMENMQVEVQEDTDITILLSATDEDSSSLSFEIVSEPTHGSLGIMKPFDGTSSYVTYTPNSDFNGTDSFTARASDTRYESEIATVTVNVLPVQDSPTANGAQTTTTQGQSVEIALSASDPDGDSLTYSVQSLPAHGNLIGTAPILRYLPSSDYSGWDSFSFRVNDGTVDSNIARIEIRVEAATSNDGNEGSGGSGSGGGSDEPVQQQPQPPSQIPPEDAEQEIPPVMESPPAIPIPEQQVPAAENEQPSAPQAGFGDAVAPRLIFPASTLVFDSQSEDGTTASYNIAAIDATDGEIAPECSPASGSKFPIGTVNVVCTATDASGNSAIGSFTIEVRSASGEEPNATPFDLQIPDLQFAVIPSVIAAIAAVAAVVVVTAARKTKAKSSQPPQPS
jgi:hypothetical protein